MGRAGRANRLRHHLGARPLDERECQRVADSLRASIAHYALQIHSGATVSRMITVAERSAREGVLEAQDDEQVRLLGHAQHVADCLERFRAVEDNDRVVAWIRKGLDRINTPGSDGLDRLLEIEVAGRLAEEGLFQVTTAEPDIVASMPQGPLTCACKHPDTMAGAARCIVQAAKQVEKQRHPGLVVVSFDSVFHQAGKFLGVSHPNEAAEWADAQLESAVSKCDGALKRYMEVISPRGGSDPFARRAVRVQRAAKNRRVPKGSKGACETRHARSPRPYPYRG